MASRTLSFFFNIDIAQAQQAFARLIQDSVEVSRQVKALGRGIREAGYALTAFGVAGVSVFKALISEGGELEQVIANIGSIASSAGEFATQGAALRQLEADIRAIGDATEFSSLEIAQAAQVFRQTGFAVAEISKELLQATRAFATIGGSNPAQAAKDISDALGALGLDATSASGLIDDLALASTRANTSISELVRALVTAGPAAQRAGIDSQFLIAALTQFAKEGQRGTAAGRRFLALIQDLQTIATSKARVKIIEAAGLDPSQFNPAIVGMEKVIENINKLDVLSRNNVVAATARRALGPVVDSIDKILELQKELESNQFSSSELADRRLNTLKGRIEILTSAFEGLKQELFSASKDALKAYVEGVTETVIATTKWVAENKELVSSLAEALIKVTEFSLIAGPIAITVGTIIVSIGQFIGALKGIAGAISFVTTAIATAGTTAATAGSTAAAAATSTATAATAAATAATAAGAAGAAAGNAAATAATGAAAAATTATGAATTAGITVSGILASIQTGIAAVVSFLPQFAAIAAIAVIVISNFDRIGELVTELGKGFLSAGSGGSEAFGLLSEALESVYNILQSIGSIILNVGEAILNVFGLGLLAEVLGFSSALELVGYFIGSILKLLVASLQVIELVIKAVDALTLGFVRLGSTGEKAAKAQLRANLAVLDGEIALNKAVLNGTTSATQRAHVTETLIELAAKRAAIEKELAGILTEAEKQEAAAAKEKKRRIQEEETRINGALSDTESKVKASIARAQGSAADFASVIKGLRDALEEKASENDTLPETIAKKFHNAEEAIKVSAEAIQARFLALTELLNDPKLSESSKDRLQKEIEQLKKDFQAKNEAYGQLVEESKASQELIDRAAAEADKAIKEDLAQKRIEFSKDLAVKEAGEKSKALEAFQKSDNFKALNAAQKEQNLAEFNATVIADIEQKYADKRQKDREEEENKKQRALEKEFRAQQDFTRDIEKLREDELRAKDQDLEADLVRINSKIDAERRATEQSKDLSEQQKKQKLSQLEATRAAELQAAKDSNADKIAKKAKQANKDKLDGANIEREILQNIVKQVHSAEQLREILDEILRLESLRRRQSNKATDDFFRAQANLIRAQDNLNRAQAQGADPKEIARLKQLLEIARQRVITERNLANAVLAQNGVAPIVEQPIGDPNPNVPDTTELDAVREKVEQLITRLAQIDEFFQSVRNQVTDFKAGADIAFPAIEAEVISLNNQLTRMIELLQVAAQQTAALGDAQGGGAGFGGGPITGRGAAAAAGNAAGAVGGGIGGIAQGVAQGLAAALNNLTSTLSGIKIPGPGARQILGGSNAGTVGLSSSLVENIRNITDNRTVNLDVRSSLDIHELTRAVSRAMFDSSIRLGSI
jgi:TP901 family phage tail tape measure protein